MSHELKIGLTIIVAAVVLFFGLRYMRGLPLLAGGYDIVVVFNDAQGLSAGSDVRISGVSVGAVRSVRLSDDARRVYAALSLRGSVEVPRASRITTGGFAALGDVYVSIEPPEGVSAGRPLTTGDTVVAAVGLDLLTLATDRAAPLAARTDTLLASAVTTLKNVEGIVDASGEDLEATLAQLRFITAAATETILAERGRLGSISTSLERAALSAERSASAVEAMTTDLGMRSPLLADSLTESVARLNRTLRQVETSLDGLDDVAVELDSTLALVRNPDGTLGLLLSDRSLYYNANAAALALERLLTDLQAEPDRYLKELRLVDVF